MSPLALVQTLTEEMASGPSILPMPAKIIFNAFLWMHKGWRWIRLGKIYTNQDNFLRLAAGHGLNALAGDSTFVRVAAISVLIATRILDAVEAFDGLQRSWKKMGHAFRNQFPLPLSQEWKGYRKGSVFSFSTILWIKTGTKRILLRIQWIALSILQVGKKALILSMRLMDAIECFSFSPGVREESVNLLFINSSECLDKLVHQKELLVEGLKNNRQTIQRVLDELGSCMTAEKMINEVEAGLNHVENFHQSVKEVDFTLGEAVSACGKKWGYECLYGFGLHHLVPASMVPPAIPPWDHPDRRFMTSRTPPLEALRKTKSQKPKPSPAPLKKAELPHVALFRGLHAFNLQ